jgi:hypothetical protein
MLWLSRQKPEPLVATILSSSEKACLFRFQTAAFWLPAVFDPAGDFMAVLTAGADGTLILLNPLTGAELRRATGVLMNGETAAFDTEDEIWPSLQVGLGRVSALA